MNGGLEADLSLLEHQVPRDSARLLAVLSPDKPRAPGSALHIQLPDSGGALGSLWP